MVGRDWPRTCIIAADAGGGDSGEGGRNTGLPPSGFTVIETPNGERIKLTKYLGNYWRRVNTALRGVEAG